MPSVHRSVSPPRQCPLTAWPHPARRRLLLLGMLLAGALPALPGCTNQEDDTMIDDALWRDWKDRWQWMQAQAERHGWALTPLRTGPPASAAELRHIARQAGLPVPAQLQALLERAAWVQQDWHVPGHLQALERQELPTSSLQHRTLWSIRHITEHAIPNFLGWKAQLADVDLSEAPNRRELWEHQFPLYSLANGDMLTIDMARAEPTEQPVRYFSHELEMLHGMALAPDLLSFITEMSRLGFAGTEWASWMRFGRADGDDYHLRADSPGGQAWLAWLARAPGQHGPDEPPPALLGQSAAERRLLEAAQAERLAEVHAALAAGARPDVIWNPDWQRDDTEYGEEFYTAMCHALANDNLAMVQALHAAGATLDTRELAIGVAVTYGSLPTVQWLIEHGARLRRWTDARYGPVHRWSQRLPGGGADSRQAYEAALRQDLMGWMPADMDPAEAAGLQEMLGGQLRAQMRRYIDADQHLAILEAMLAAGADPDERGDNGATLLMSAGPRTARLLLAHGADVEARSSFGDTALHRAGTPDIARLLVQHGAPRDARATPPPGDSGSPSYTPLQSALLGRSPDVARALLDLGADPTVLDGAGRDTLSYCLDVAAFELVRVQGLDPHAPRPDGGTLLHNLYRMTSVRAAFDEEVAYLDYLLAQGIAINAADHAGWTVLHVAAERSETPADLALLIARGADPALRDAQGRRALDLVPRSLTEVRALLA